MLPMSLTSFQIKKCAQTENVEWGKDIHWKWKRKTKKYGADTCIKQTDFKTICLVKEIQFKETLTMVGDTILNKVAKLYFKCSKHSSTLQKNNMALPI